MQAHPQCLSAQLSVNIGEDRKQPTTFQIIGAIIINHNHYNFIIGLLMKCAIIIIYNHYNFIIGLLVTNNDKQCQRQD